MTRTKTFPINTHPKFLKGTKINSVPNYSGSYAIRGNGNSLISEVDTMSIDYIARPEFDQFEKRLDSKFENVELSIDNAVKSLKEEIKHEKLTTKRFWVGISVPAIIGLGSLVVSIIGLFIK